MNKNYLIAAIPFAIIFDVALGLKAYGYSDPTLTVLGLISLVVFGLLVIKALGGLSLPTFRLPSFQPQVKEVHHHHYHESRCEGEDEDDCDDEGDGYTEEDLNDAREEGRKEGYDDGYDTGHEAGYDAGYAERESEETSEAEQLAKVVIELLEKKGVVVPTAPAPVTPAETATETAQAEGQAQA